MEWWWTTRLRERGIDALIDEQGGIVARAQLLAAGWSAARIRRPLRNRRWRTVHPRVYVTHTGPIGYGERLVAALLYAGPAAAGVITPQRNSWDCSNLIRNGLCSSPSPSVAGWQDGPVS